ncbi:MAG: hypothetical protein KDD50_14250, partial [Bdellovibrionales bacterium]|nr:hypothetical protein [Bdellovibrionales bacterium]
AAFMQSLTKSKSRTQLGFTLHNLKQDLVNLIRDQNSWKKTVFHDQNAQSLACLQTTVDCHQVHFNDGELIPIQVIVNSADEIFLENEPPGLKELSGFTQQGLPCRGFSETTPSDQCPIRFLAYWRPLCEQTEACMNPTIEVVIKLKYSGSDTSVKEGLHYVKVIRPNLLQNLASQAFTPRESIEKTTCEYQNGIYLNGFCQHAEPLKEESLSKEKDEAPVNKSVMCNSMTYDVDGYSITVHAANDQQTVQTQSKMFGSKIITNGEFYCSNGSWTAQLKPTVVNFQDPSSFKQLLETIQ